MIRCRDCGKEVRLKPTSKRYGEDQCTSCYERQCTKLRQLARLQAAKTMAQKRAHETRAISRRLAAQQQREEAERAELNAIQQYETLHMPNPLRAERVIEQWLRQG